MKTLRFSLSIAVAALMLVSCDKNDDTTPNSDIVNEETVSAEFATDVDAIADEAFDIASTELKSASTERNFISSCAVITYDKASTLKMLTIDFGTGCEGKDGKTRSGKIIVTTESFTEVNKQRTITFDSYMVDGRSVQGSIIKTITRLVDENSRLANISEDIIVELPDNKGTATRVAVMTRLYQFNVLGVVADNKILSWGETVFTRANGEMITKTIDESTPLVYRVLCKQTVSGIMTIDFDGNKTWTVDYGNGTCDRAVIISDGENTWVAKW